MQHNWTTVTTNTKKNKIMATETSQHHLNEHELSFRSLESKSKNWSQLGLMFYCRGENIHFLLVRCYCLRWWSCLHCSTHWPDTLNTAGSPAGTGSWTGSPSATSSWSLLSREFLRGPEKQFSFKVPVCFKSIYAVWDPRLRASTL